LLKTGQGTVETMNIHTRASSPVRVQASAHWGKGIYVTHRNQMCWKCLNQLLTQPNEVIIASTDNILSFIKLSTGSLKIKTTCPQIIYKLGKIKPYTIEFI